MLKERDPALSLREENFSSVDNTGEMDFSMVLNPVSGNMLALHVSLLFCLLRKQHLRTKYMKNASTTAPPPAAIAIITPVEGPEDCEVLTLPLAASALGEIAGLRVAEALVDVVWAKEVIGTVGNTVGEEVLKMLTELAEELELVESADRLVVREELGKVDEAEVADDCEDGVTGTATVVERLRPELEEVSDDPTERAVERPVPTSVITGII